MPPKINYFCNYKSFCYSASSSVQSVKPVVLAIDFNLLEWYGEDLPFATNISLIQLHQNFSTNFLMPYI